MGKPTILQDTRITLGGMLPNALLLGWGNERRRGGTGVAIGARARSTEYSHGVRVLVAKWTPLFLALVAAGIPLLVLVDGAVRWAVGLTSVVLIVLSAWGLLLKRARRNDRPVPATRSAFAVGKDHGSKFVGNISVGSDFFHAGDTKKSEFKDNVHIRRVDEE